MSTEQLIAMAKSQLAAALTAYHQVGEQLDVVRNMPGQPGIDEIIARHGALHREIRGLRLTIENPDPQEP